MERLPVSIHSANSPDTHARRPIARIEDFIQRRGLAATLIANTLLVVADPSIEALPDSHAENYLKARAEAEKERIVNTCLLVARDAHANGYATGTMAAPDGTNTFISWANHATNFDLLPDGSAVGFDLTAAENIGSDSFPISILAVHSNSLDELTDHIGDLYGGEWNTTTERRVDFYEQ
jgi:hypothetical protein